MRDAVADVETERPERGVDDLGGAGRPDDLQRSGIGRERRDPPGDDHVTEVGDVVAVQMRQQQRTQPVGPGTGRRQPLLHTASAVDEERLPARPHECRRARATRVGNRTSGAEQRDLDHGVRYTRHS
jgi:hypothetical protein